MPHGTTEAEDRHSNFYDTWVNLARRIDGDSSTAPALGQGRHPVTGGSPDLDHRIRPQVRHREHPDERVGIRVICRSSGAVALEVPVTLAG